MKEKDRIYQKIGFKAGVVFSITVGILMIGAVVYNNGNGIDVKQFNPLEPYVKPGASWHSVMKMYSDGSIVLGAENPSPSATDFLEIFFINHSADKYYTQENTSSVLEGHCTANNLGYVNADNVELDIAHSTLFDIVIKVQGDSAHCKRGSDWWDSDLNITLTWDEYSLTDDQPDGNTTYPLAAMNTSAFTYLYEIFYWDNGGSGYQLSKGQNTGTDPIFELAAYY